MTRVPTPAVDSADAGDRVDALVSSLYDELRKLARSERHGARGLSTVSWTCTPPAGMCSPAAGSGTASATLTLGVG